MVYSCNSTPSPTASAVGLDCSGAYDEAAVILEHENLLVQACIVLHEGKKATKEDIRHALVDMGRVDQSKRLVVRCRGRRAAAHPDPGLAGQVRDAVRQQACCDRGAQHKVERQDDLGKVHKGDPRY